jgi:hypothetical protein
MTPHSALQPWRQKLTEICIQLTWHSPSPTPLLPALTLSAGEYRVSGGELKVSRQVGLPRNPRARRPKPKNGLPLFLAAFSKLLSCRHGGATGVLLLLRVHGPCRSLRSSHLSWVCRPYLFYSSYAISSTTLCLLRYFLRTATVMGRKQTGDELNARAKANGYKRGAHREEDSRRDCNKHKDDTIKDQDKALDRYVL